MPLSVLVITGNRLTMNAQAATDRTPAWSKITSIGAIATSGTVCRITVYGYSARSSTRLDDSITPSATPTTADSAKPQATATVVFQVAIASSATRAVASRTISLGAQNLNRGGSVHRTHSSHSPSSTTAVPSGSAS